MIMDKSVAEPGYHNPSALVQLIDHVNEATTVVEGVEMLALVPSLHCNRRFCSELGLRVLPLGGLLHLEMTGGIVIPYKGYMEVNLIIPG